MQKCYSFRFWGKNWKNPFFTMLDAVVLRYPETNPANFPGYLGVKQSFARTSGIASSFKSISVEVFKFSLPCLLQWQQILWGAWCERQRGASQTGRPPQEAGLHTPGKPRPNKSTAEGLRTQSVEQLPRVSRPISLPPAAFLGALELIQLPRAHL